MMSPSSRTRQGALYLHAERDGGVIDDLIVYFMSDTEYRLVVNASTREKDLAWIRKQAAAFRRDVIERAELAMIAVQGPKARELAAACIDAE